MDEQLVALWRPQPWMADAACKEHDRDVFFPHRGQNDKLAEAKAVCAGCLVRLDCLGYAIDNDEKFGIWGGRSERERRRMRRARRQAA